MRISVLILEFKELKIAAFKYKATQIPLTDDHLNRNEKRH